MMEKEKLKEFRKKGKVLDPILRIGKSGLTDETIRHLKLAIKKHKLIKVKMLKSFTESHDKKAAAKELCDKVGAVLIEQIGFVVVMYKR